MEVWVVYRDYGKYEGYSLPEKAFDSYEKAKSYVDENNKDSIYTQYELVGLDVE